MSTTETSERPALYEFVGNTLLAHAAHHVLDIACGPGDGTATIARSVREASIVGVDLAPELIEHAKKEFSLANLNYEVGDALHTRFSEYSFDAVVSCHTIEHFFGDDQELLMRELRRVLVPKGLLIIATPDLDVWRSLGIAGQQEDHKRELTQSDFVRIVETAGFTVTGVFGQSVMRHEASLSRRMLNILKRFDVFRLRRVLGGSVGRIDRMTRPIASDVSVVRLGPRERASTTVLVAVRNS